MIKLLGIVIAEHLGTDVSAPGCFLKELKGRVISEGVLKVGVAPQIGPMVELA
jgi:hypothetical protein